MSKIKYVEKRFGNKASMTVPTKAAKKKDETAKFKKRIQSVEADLKILWSAMDSLTANCSCTIAERISGHHVDCSVPHVRALLDRSSDE